MTCEPDAPGHFFEGLTISSQLTSFVRLDPAAPRAHPSGL